MLIKDTNIDLTFENKFGNLIDYRFYIKRNRHNNLIPVLPDYFNIKLNAFLKIIMFGNKKIIDYRVYTPYKRQYTSFITFLKEKVRRLSNNKIFTFSGHHKINQEELMEIGEYNKRIIIKNMICERCGKKFTYNALKSNCFCSDCEKYLNNEFTIDHLLRKL